MREYCLVNKDKTTVLNMCMVYGPDAPVLNEYQSSRGWKWVPVNQVPTHVLSNYKYWNERP